MTARRVTAEEAVDILDEDEGWKEYQVDYPEATCGPYAIKHFSIAKYEQGRLDNLVAEGMDRDTGSGDFRKLVEMGAGEDGRDLIWMSDTRAEIMEHTPMINKLFWCAPFGQARRILINGLGLGLVAHAALGYPQVEEIDVVEHDADIVELVGQYLTKDPRVRIHLGDAYDIKWPAGTRWDLAWHDIWPSISDENLTGMDKLRAKYKRRVGWQGYWQKRGCLKMKRVFEQLEEGTLPPHVALEILGGKFHF
jgi:hypothetical protein